MSATVADVVDALAGVKDPEIPVVSVLDMGMIGDVAVEGEHARVVVLPTFTGCPAIDVIRSDVAEAVARVDGIASVSVELSYEPPWTPDRISPEGRAKLRDFGLAPPSSARPVMIADIGLPSEATCPFCGSTDTRPDSMFGPTPCRALYYCNSCRNPFEQFKPV